MSLLKRFVTQLFFFLWTSTLLSQTSFEVLRYFDLPEATADTEIYDILQDRDGFMWFGTSIGLYRFDGLEYTIYRSEYDNLNSLTDNEVRSLMQDQHGNLWIGTLSGGISVLDMDTNTFKHYRKSSKQLSTPYNYGVYSILEDSRGVVWVATHGNGLGKFDAATETFRYFRSDKTHKNSLGQDYITKILEANDGDLWIGLNGGGLDKFNLETEHFTHYKYGESSDLRQNFRNNVIRDFLSVDDETVLLATFGGINRLAHKESAFNHFSSESQTQLKTSSFNSIFKVNDAYYVTSYLGYIYKLTGDLMTPILVHQDIGGLRSSYVDENDRVWLGFVGGKVAYISTKSKFGYQRVFKESTEVLSLFKDENTLYLGTRNGLYNVSKNNNAKQVLPVPEVFCIEKDTLGQFWLGTNKSGVVVWNSQNGQQKNFRYSPGNSRGLRHDTILDIYCDSFGSVWISTSVGVSQWLPDSQSFFTRGSANFSDVLRLNEEELWCASEYGIAVLNLKTNAFYMKQSSLERQKDSMLSNQVKALFSPDNDSILIGTKDGLNIFLRSQKKMLNLHEITNIPYTNIKEIVQDHHKNYWAITSKGLLHFDLATGNYRFIDANDGLKFSNSFLGNNLIFDKKSHTLFVGGYGGYYAFVPSADVEDVPRVNTLITQVHVADTVFRTQGHSVPARDQEVAVFKHNQNVVSFDFVGLHYQNPEALTYRYRLEGQQQDWTTSDKSSVTFANLAPGDYTFMVNASLNANNWPRESARFSFNIRPPFWATWWAYLVYALLLLVLAYYFTQAFLTKQRLKTQWHLEHLEAEKAREISIMKSRFFANVSHEFRTPLTLIKGPINELLEKKLDIKTHKSLQLVKRNTMRLEQLILQLLDYSKANEHQLPVKKEATQIFGFLRAIASSFVSMAQSKNLLYQIAIPLENQMLLVDKEKLETILNNLISNAIKFIPGRGSVIVSAVTEISNNKDAFLTLSVTDTGPGLSSKQKEQVFERYHRIDPTVEGTGIGLALTKELVEVLGGTVQVLDNEHQGSVFKVKLPVTLITTTTHSKRHLNSIPSEEQLQERQKGQTILLVEDNLELQDYLKDMLEPNGTILQAVNGKAALELAKQHVPDIIVSDYMMPGMDGGRLCREIRADQVTSHIPFIMLTAKATDEDKIAGLVDGATDYIFKPFEKKELLYKVQNILAERKRLQKQWHLQMFTDEATTPIASQDDRFLEKFKTLVITHMGDHDLSVNFLGAELGMSRVQLYRKVLATTGMATSHLIKRLRIQKASELLKNNWGNVSQVAYEVGFQNLSHFSKSFKEVYGMTPSQYANQES